MRTRERCSTTNDDERRFEFVAKINTTMHIICSASLQILSSASSAAPHLSTSSTVITSFTIIHLINPTTTYLTPPCLYIPTSQHRANVVFDYTVWRRRRIGNNLPDCSARFNDDHLLVDDDRSLSSVWYPRYIVIDRGVVCDITSSVIIAYRTIDHGKR